MSHFRKTWLDLWCIGVMVFGAILAGAGIVGFEAGARFILILQNPTNPPVFNDIERFAFGLMGAITIGWGLALFYFFRAAHASNMGNKMYRQAFVVLIIWNLVDGYISYRTGFQINIVSNLLLSLGFVVPLYWTGKLRR